MKLNQIFRSDSTGMSRSLRNRSRVTRSAMAARPIAFEPLEDRKLMSLTVGLQVADSSTPYAASVTSVGQVVNLNIVATVSGTTSGGNDGLDSVMGSFLGAATTSGAVGGNLATLVGAEFAASGAQDGTSQDLNGDGNLDVGSNDNSSITNFFAARAGGILQDGTVSGDSQSFIIGTATYTVTSLNSGKAADLTFRLRNGLSAGAYDAVWLEDGVGETDQGGTILSGTAVAITDPNVVVASGGSVAGSVTKTASGSSSAYSGVTVYLDANNDSVLDNGEKSTTTSSSGTYSFSGVPAGAYIVRQEVPTGATQTTPVTGYGIHITVTNGGALTGENFVDTAPVTATGSTISGTVKVGSTGVSGETVYLDANNDSVLDNGELSTTTSGGAYSFSNVPAGAYIIRQKLLAGYTQTTPASGYGIHITATNGGSLTNENFVDTSPVSGGTVSGTVTGSVSGETVYLDANNDSVLDNGEKSTTLATNGTYSFTGVTPGAYIIRQVLPSGIKQVSPVTGYGIHITVASGSSLTGENFTDAVSTTKLTGTTIGTAGSYKSAGNTIGKATDGDLTTFFDGPVATGNWVGLDLGSSKSISQIAYAPRASYASRMVGGEFQISTTADFSSGVTTIYTISATPAYNTLTTITLSSPVTARYIRYLSPANTYGDVAEIAFYG